MEQGEGHAEGRSTSRLPAGGWKVSEGNDCSPVAGAIILNISPDKIPPDLESVVRAGIEAGDALSGTVQTENIGFETIVCNIDSNPNIHYLIVGGPESEGHLTGESLKALIRHGADEKKRILSTGTHIKVFIVHARHSRESGNPELFSGTLDPRFRGDDERGFRTLSCVALYLGLMHPAHSFITCPQT